MFRMLLPALFLFLLVPNRGNALFAQSTVFEELFDGVLEPDLPASAVSADDSWSTSSSSESSGSGGNNLRHGGTTPGDIIFGPINLENASSVTVSYLARRTSSYPADSLTLAVSTDAGLTWTTLMGPGSALPEATSAYESVSTPIPDSVAAGSIIRLRFRGYGGSSSGSNIRIDDLAVTADVDFSDVSDTFGFGTASSTATGMSVLLPLNLAWTGADSIQGIQFDVDFDTSLLALTDVLAGSAVSASGWTVDYTSGSGVGAGSSRVLLLGGDDVAITSGLYTGLLFLEFQPVGAASDTVTTIALRDLIVSAYDPGGAGLSVVATPSEHEMTIDVGLADIALSTDSLSLGSTAVGSPATGIVTIFNPAGDGDLVVSDVTSTSDLFSASSTSFSVPPGDSVEVVVTFAPTQVAFGFSAATILLFHNAPATSSTVAVSATGTSGRGDATSDGIVDVADVVAGIDAALERTDPAESLPTIDLHPFPAGDGRIDVRDLTVLVHAVLNGEWPDAVVLPVPALDTTPAGKGEAVAMVLSESEATGTVLSLNARIPLRGIQLELSGLGAEPAVVVDAPAASVDAARSGAAVTRSTFEPETGRFIYLTASAHSVLGANDVLEIRGLPDDFEPRHITGAVGITSTLDRLNLSVVDRRDAHTEQPDYSRIGISVFPNPARPGLGASVRVIQSKAEEASGGARWTIRLVDLLGREIASPRAVSVGKDIPIDTSHLAPGIYFVRIGDGKSVVTTPLTIVH